jgi:hypothetical protein
LRLKGAPLNSTLARILGLLVLLLLAVGIVGYQRGWFEFGAENTDGTSRAAVTLRKDKFKEDKEKLRQFASDKLAAVQEKLNSTRARSKDLTGAAKVKADKEIEDLTTKKKELETKVKAIEQVTEDKIDSVQKDFEDALKELEKDKK